jgi:O-antigen/teichoic acid export membrane protein
MTEDLRRKVTAGLFWATIQNWGGKVISLLLFGLLARLLDPHGMGVFASAVAVLGFVSLFVDQGLSEAIVQRPTMTPELLNTAFLINLSLAVILFAIVWIAAPAIAAYMKIGELTNILRAASLSIPFTALGFSQQAMQRRNFQYRWIGMSALCSTILSGIVGLILALNGFGAWSLVAQVVVAAAANSLMLWFNSQWRFSLKVDLGGVRSLFAYGLNRFGTHLLYFSYSRGLELYLATSLGAGALGIYLVGVKIYQSLMFALNNAIVDVAHSGFSRIAGDRPALIRGYYKAITLTSAITVPVFVLLACVSPEVTAVCFGAKWQASAAIMRPMALLGAVELIELYNATVFNALGRPSIGLFLLMLKTPMAFLAIWLAHGMPLATIVWSYVVGQLIGMLPSFFITRKLIGISIRTLFSQIFPFIAACVVASAAVYALRSNGALDAWHPVYRLIVLSAAGVLSYAVFVALTARNLFSEIVAMLRAGRQKPS